MDRAHIHPLGGADALRATLRAYDLHVYVRVCGVEPGCFTVSSDSRSIAR